MFLETAFKHPRAKKTIPFSWKNNPFLLRYARKWAPLRYRIVLWHSSFIKPISNAIFNICNSDQYWKLLEGKNA